MRQRRKPVSRLQQPKPRHALRKRRPAPATPLAQNYAVFPGNVAPRNTGSVRRPFPRRPPRPSFSTSVYPRVYRASPPAASFTCAMRMLRRRAHRNRRTLPQALRQLHSRAPCACFVAALIGTAAHFRKPSGSFILVRRARASSARPSEPPHTCANPPAASFSCAMRVLRRRVYRKRRLPPRLPRKPSGGFTKVRSRSP